MFNNKIYKRLYNLEQEVSQIRSLTILLWKESFKLQMEREGCKNKALISNAVYKCCYESDRWSILSPSSLVASLKQDYPECFAPTKRACK